jgi:hypothetical protein
MPYKIQARDIPLKDRKPNLIAYRSSLRRMVKDLTMPEHLRHRFEEKLARVDAELRDA